MWGRIGIPWVVGAWLLGRAGGLPFPFVGAVLQVDRFLRAFFGSLRALGAEVVTGGNVILEEIGRVEDELAFWARVVGAPPVSSATGVGKGHFSSRR